MIEKPQTENGNIAMAIPYDLKKNKLFTHERFKRCLS